MTESDLLNIAQQEGEPFADDGLVHGKRVALVGRFGGMNHREAKNLIRSYGGLITEPADLDVDWIVIGADEPPLAEADLLSQRIRDAAARGTLEILSETQLWQRLGLVDREQAIRKYYTPAMLAHLLGVSIRVIRRWHRRGLIAPVRSLHKLPYFDFQEVATARRLASWIASGASEKAIESRLVELVGILPDVSRPLDQLSILVEGKDILLRHGGGLLELGGQLRFDFEAIDEAELGELNDDDRQRTVLAFPSGEKNEEEQDELLRFAYAAEDSDDLETAIDLCHAILARDGARADISFQLGELFYRINQTSAARERFYMATELDPDFVEARASLGNVLAEEGQLELAIAAYRGALSLHSDYADVHLRLAKLLDDTSQSDLAVVHWKRFLELAPSSPWADEARSRLES